MRVTFAGEERLLVESLTFGRAADLELDTSPLLHRVAGEFNLHDGAWWLINRGSSLFLRLVTADGSRLDLAPGARHALSPGRGTVSIRVGVVELLLEFSVPAEQAIHPATVDQTAEASVTSGVFVNLTPREVDFLVSFARPTLEGKNEPLPSYESVAAIWHVSQKTLDNTLQTLRRKLRNAGLLRHEQLDGVVQVAVAHSLVARSDLEWADFYNGPRRAADGPRFASR